MMKKSTAEGLFFTYGEEPKAGDIESQTPKLAKAIEIENQEDDSSDADEQLVRRKAKKQWRVKKQRQRALML